MLKIGFQIKEVGDTLNIAIVDPTEKQLNAASDNERAVAQAIKELFEKRLIDLLEENTNEKEN